MLTSWRWCLLFALVSLATGAAAVSQTLPPFRPLRYDESYTFLKTDTTANWYNRTKYTPLGKKRNSYISFGGDMRFQYFWFKNEDWGESPADKDGYIFTRWLAHADLHAGRYVRAFVQLQSSLANGLEKTPSPVDENQLDLHQAFVDLRWPLQQSALVLRLGRQELSYGSQRLVALREGPNNRQSFDAAKLFFTKDNLKADLFFSYYVKSARGIFDDGFNKNTRFWGSYFVFNKISFLRNVDLYYLGLWKAHATFDNGIGEELRHSLGARVWNGQRQLKYDIEGVYQFGTLAEKNIRAWTFSVNAAYTFNHARLKPELGLKTELISGNKVYVGNKLQTFNPLFPRGSYFGLASLIGPSNLFDIHPSLALSLSEKTSLGFDNDIFWRYSTQDGIYAPNASLIYSGKASGHSFVGSQLATDLTYTPNRYLMMRAEFTWFKPGAFLKDVGPGKTLLFAGATVQCKF